MSAPTTAIGLFLGGGIGLSLCNQIHVESGVLSYPDPVLFDQAWWAPPLFGAATLAICAGAGPFARTRAKPSAAALASSGAWFAGAYVASGVFNDSPHALAVAFVVVWAGRVAAAPDRGVLVAFSILLAAGGTGFEAVLVGADMFSYADFDPVPIWLPGLYLNGAALALAITRRYVCRVPA